MSFELVAGGRSDTTCVDHDALTSSSQSSNARRASSAAVRDCGNRPGAARGAGVARDEPSGAAPRVRVAAVGGGGAAVGGAGAGRVCWLRRWLLAPRAVVPSGRWTLLFTDIDLWKLREAALRSRGRTPHVRSSIAD